MILPIYWYLQTLQRPVSHPLRQRPWRLLTPLRPDSADGLRTRTRLSLRHQRRRFRATLMNWSPLLYIVPREPVGKIPIYFFRFKKQSSLDGDPRDLFYMPLSQRKPRKADIRYAAPLPPDVIPGSYVGSKRDSASWGIL